MEVVIQNDQEKAGEVVADRIVELYRRKPEAVLGLATGSSPLPIYRALRRRYEAGDVSFAKGQTFNLDEYVGLPDGHPEAYRTVIRTEFTDHVDFRPEAVHYPDVFAADLDLACSEYEAFMRGLGGVDLQLLGIGENGHIGFNEPSCSLVSRTRVEYLTRSTRAANARFFDDDIAKVPEKCITQGLGTILDAKHAVMVAFGEKKADAIANMVEGSISTRWPASILQQHPHVTLIVDEAAASKLQLADYYREAFGDTPSWRAR